MTTKDKIILLTKTTSTINLKEAYENDFRLIINIYFYDNLSTPLSIKALALLFLLDSLYPNPSFFAWHFNYFSK